MASTRVLRSHKAVKTPLLRRLPPELREMIYNFALLNPVDEIDKEKLIKEPSNSNKYNKKTPISFQKASKKLRPAPEFLAALRADPELYSEALVVFYKINTFPLTKDSFVIFKDLKKPALELIQRVNIFIEKEEMNYWTTRLLLSPRSKLYRYLRNLRHVEFLLDHSIDDKFVPPLEPTAKNWRKLDRVVLKQYCSKVTLIGRHTQWLRPHLQEPGNYLAMALNDNLEDQREGEEGPDEWDVVVEDHTENWKMFVQVIERVPVDISA